MNTPDPGPQTRLRSVGASVRGAASEGARQLSAMRAVEGEDTVGPEPVRDRWPDYAVVLLLVGWTLISHLGMGSGIVLVGLLQALPLFWRRSHPLLAVIGVALGCLAQVFVSDEPYPSNIAVPIAVYSAAAFGTRLQSRAVLGIGIVGAAVAAVDWSVRWITNWSQALVSMGFAFIFLAMFVGVSWVLGDVVRRRKAVVSRLQEQNRALARDQAQRSRLAAQDERAAIAREMHDVVAHSLAVVVVQADGALYAARAALEQPPGIGPDRAALERAAATLETLAQTARTSLGETRKLVGVLREEGSAAEYSPLQGLAHLDELAQRVRDSGVPVELVVRGAVDDLPKEVDLAAFRVVQEAFTNALKHAGPDATVRVDVTRSPSVLLVRVVDDGLGLASDADGEGNGILGMSERVDVLGGRVTAGPRAHGGWEVMATIPLGGQAGVPSAPASGMSDPASGASDPAGPWPEPFRIPSGSRTSAGGDR